MQKILIFLLFLTNLTFVHAQTYFKDTTVESGLYHIETAWGASWVDYNQDGYLDLFISNHMHRPSYLFHNRGDGLFEEIYQQLNLHVGLDDHSSSWGDINNNGFPDVFTTAGVHHPDYFLLNHQGKHFSDETVAKGLNKGTQGRGRSSAWMDFNNDGLLDLIVINILTENLLYLAQNDGTFKEVAQKQSLNSYLAEQEISLSDVDLDHDIDMFLPEAPFKNHDKLYINQGNGYFTEKNALETSLSFSGLHQSSAFGDYDNDGDMDLFIVSSSQKSSSILLENDGTGHFTNVTKQSNIDVKAQSNLAHASWADVNNDGWLDLIVILGGTNEKGNQKNYLFENTGKKTFRDMSKRSGFSHKVKGNSSNASWGDYDNDGDLDLFITNGRGSTTPFGPYQLFNNQIANRNNWLKINLLGTKSNKDGYGAKLTVYTKNQKQYREAIPFNAMAQNTNTIHFGLGKHKWIDRLEIIWPSGVVQWIHGIPANETLTIQESNVSQFFYSPVLLLLNKKHIAYNKKLMKSLLKKGASFDKSKPIDRSIMWTYYIQKQFKKIQVSQSEIKTYFQKHFDKYVMPEMLWLEEIAIGPVTPRKKPPRPFTRQANLAVQYLHEGFSATEVMDKINVRKWKKLFGHKADNKSIRGSLQQGYVTKNIAKTLYGQSLSDQLFHASPNDIIGPIYQKELLTLHSDHHTYPVHRIFKIGKKSQPSKPKLQTFNLFIKDLLKNKKLQQHIKQNFDVDMPFINITNSRQLFFDTFLNLFDKNSLPNDIDKNINEFLHHQNYLNQMIRDMIPPAVLKKIPSPSTVEMYELNHIYIGKDANLARNVHSMFKEKAPFYEITEHFKIKSLSHKDMREAISIQKFKLTGLFSKNRIINDYGLEVFEKIKSLNSEKNYFRLNDRIRTHFFTLNRSFKQEIISQEDQKNVLNRQTKINNTLNEFNKILKDLK